MRRIVFASSEAVPFIKTGGLADVVGALPKCLCEDGYETVIILPKYACMDEALKKGLKYKTHFYVNLGWRKQYAGIFETKLDKVVYYFIDSEYYFGGDVPYRHLHEDLEKFAFFDKAVIQALKVLDFKADIIHCNDWQTALIPAYLKTEFSADPFYADMKTVFTIHNIRYQGRWILNAIKDITGLDNSCFTANGLESYGDAVYLKGGVAYADKITTVSESYARDICTPEGGEGLDGILRQRGNDLLGIVNGIDYELFDPKTDPYISRHFDSKDYLAAKRTNKNALQEEMHLKKDNSLFMIGMVSRMTDQKGFDLLMPVIDELLRKGDVQLVILGSGEEKYTGYCSDLARRYPDYVATSLVYTECQAHKIYAGVDALLMPSMFEPCGLSQMISMRYGTVPIVRETGGLNDTVEAYNEFEGTGTGFSFRNFNAHEMLHTIRYAKSVYFNDRKEWDRMIGRCMKEDFSWTSSAKKYEELYEQLLYKM